MSERLVRLEARGFRGVPDRLSIALPGGRSLIVLGDNGTGKSTIGDALEWYFTGRVTYLAHEGREAAITHLAPKLPTAVEVETTGSLGGTATLPDGGPPAARAAGARETFLLRGRALADFVNRTKGEKWRSLAELLGLEEIDRLRLDLQTASNELTDELEKARRQLAAAALDLARVQVKPDEASILSALQAAARAAAISEPATIADAINPTWLGSIGQSGRKSLELGAALREVTTLSDIEPVRTLAREWNTFAKSATASDRSRLSFLRFAGDYLKLKPTPGACPLCGQPVTDVDLVREVETALRALKQASDDYDHADSVIKRLERGLEDAFAVRRRIRERCRQVGVAADALDEKALTEVRDAKTARRMIDLVALDDQLKHVRAWDTETGSRLLQDQKSSQSADAKRLTALGSLRELASTWAKNRSTVLAADIAASRARDVHDAYQATQAAFFNTILSSISKRVAALYTRLHPEEEIRDVKLELWTEKGVEFAGAFHGHALKPPHGVLSESHLNSLGIAMFLAMAETFNEQLGFIVLDDVVNSFDVSHRGALAELLVDEFEDWQVVVLTHDPLFFSQLSRRAGNWSRLEFTSWSFEEGPREGGYRITPLVVSARSDLTAGNLGGSARAARRALEELLQEACEALEAPLPFRRGFKNDRREVGELMPGLRRGLRDASPKYLERIKTLLDALDADVASVLNVEVHAATGWTSRAEIDSAVTRIEQLTAEWTCVACGTRIWAQGTPRASRCKCGQKTFPGAP